MKKLFSSLIIIFILFTSVQGQTLNRDIKICVISDVHLYDSTLGVTGAAFQTYLMQDRKLLAESESILKSAIKIIKEEAPDFVLIPGDLTKDGEKVSHELLAEYLSDLKAAGIPSFVVPGNHDVANPHSLSFEDTTTSHVPSVTAEEFAQIYNNFGFDDAIAKDDSSLSYIVEPVEGLQIFALDDCLYKYHTDSPITAGKFSSSTLDWIVEQLVKAKEEDKIIMGMMHHGILEHYTGQKLFFPEYVVENYDSVSILFAQYGMKVVFTGHYHAQDITIRKFSAEEMPDGVATEIVDIETGSLVTYPNPVRILNVSADLTLDIDTKNVTEIDYPTDTLTFPKYSKLYLETGLNVLVPYILTSSAYGLSAEEAAVVTPYLVNAFAAHYQGDEVPDTETLQFINSLLSSADTKMLMLGNALGSLYTDLNPADNTCEIESLVTDVKENSNEIPISMYLYQNYPNPFNPTTTIQFDIAEKGAVNIKIYDLLGREITTLVNEVKSAGNYKVNFDASSLATGIYYYTLKHNNSIVTKSMVLMK